jgi:hypothetical protein
MTNYIMIARVEYKQTFQICKAREVENPFLRLETMQIAAPSRYIIINRKLFMNN